MKIKQNVQPMNLITKWTPLVTRFGIVAEAGSKTQFYYATEGQYIPSRAVTPLKLVAMLNVVDPDGVLPTGNKISSCDVKWYEGDYDTQITADTSGYSLGTDGSLTVTKNVHPNSPIQVLCRATFVDPRNGNTLVYEDRAQLSSINKSDSSLTIFVNRAAKITFNPLLDDATVTITANMKLGSEEVPDANAKYWWYVVDNGVEYLIDTLDTAIEYVSGQGTNTLTVNAMYTNQSIIRVKGARYEGTAPTTCPDNAPSTDVALIYSLPDVTANIYSPNSTVIRDGDNSKLFKCELMTNRTVLTDTQANEHYLVRWYKKPTTAGGVATQLADGTSITVPTSELTLAGRQAMQVYVDVYGFGAYGYLVDSSGKMITTADGKAILART